MRTAETVFWTGCSFLFGVFSAGMGWSVAAATAVFAAGIFSPIAAKRLPMSLLFAGAASVFLGAFYYHASENAREAAMRLPDMGMPAHFSGIVSREPFLTDRSQRLTIRLEPPYRGEISAVLSRIPEYRYGDLIDFEGAVEADEYRQGARQSFVAVFPEANFREAHRGPWLHDRLVSFKREMVEKFRMHLPGDHAALLGGLTFGARSDFSPELKSAMRRSGTTHLVALSGYNISLIIVAVAALLGMFFSRRAVFLLTVAAVILFVVMAGGEASVVRAALMGFLALLAGHTGRIYSVRHAIVLAACAMALADPQVLAYDAGFQLSFLSLLGIVYLQPALRALYGRADIPQWSSYLFTTAAAQLAVLPALLLYFDSVSLLSIISNTLILGLVPLTMALGFGIACAGFLLPVFSVFMSWMAYPLLSYQIGVMHFFAAFDVPVRLAVHPAALCTVYYGAMILFMLAMRKKHA